MQRLIYFLIGGLLLLVACRESEIPTPEPQPEPEPVASYEAYLEPVEEAVYKEDLFNGSPTFPTYWPQDQYDYRLPCFNPSDPYEIAYLRKDRDVLGECPGAVFIFSFRTGEARQVASNACYGLDWSSKGWLIYTGVDRKIWKVKANGDSLTQLTLGEGYHNDAKWSPDGEHFVYAHEGSNRERRVCDADGNVLHQSQSYFVPLGWLNLEEILVGQSPSGGLAAYNWESEIFQTVYQEGSFSFLSYFDAQSLRVFVNPGHPTYFFRYNLHNDTQDTLGPMYKTYAYGVGDYAHQTERAIVSLVRQDWKDSLANEIY